MRILVTGAGGFLGPRIVESLLLQGCVDLRLQFRQPGGRQEMLLKLRERFPGARIEPIIGNLLARGASEPMVKDVDCVVHAAAGTKGAAADMFLNSVVATRNLLNACLSSPPKRVVLVSSFSVYNTEHLPRGTVLSEDAPTELTGATKGAYGFAKTQQEQLVRSYAQQGLAPPIILRPGVIYGPGGGAFSARVGISALGRFIRLGNRGLLPLTYVENCADAIARAALEAAPGAVFNVVDDELPTCGEFLRLYRRDVTRLKVLPVPYPIFLMGARWLSSYNRRSKGQLPDLFSPQVVRSMYRPLRYSNAALKALGWRQRVPTSEGMQRHFAALRASLSAG